MVSLFSLKNDPILFSEFFFPKQPRIFFLPDSIYAAVSCVLFCMLMSQIIEVDIPQSLFEEQGRELYGAHLLQLQVENI